MTDFGEFPRPTDNGSKTGKQFKQRVLPETIAASLQQIEEHLPLNLIEDLKKLRWQGIEHRDYPGLPSFNIFLTSHKGEERASMAIANSVINRARALVKLVGYRKPDLKPLSVFIDPLLRKYKDAKGIFQLKERSLWLKAHEKGLGVDHELAHWLTLGLFNPDSPPPLLSAEGFATWLSWQVKDESERKQFPSENYREIIKRVGPYAFSRENLSLDMEIESVPAMYLGAMLFDVLYEECNGDVKKLAHLWRSAGQHSCVSEWIKSTGFPAEDIEKKWKDKILGDNL